MAGISFREIRPEDLQDPNLSELNAIIRALVDEIHRLSGLYGTIELLADVNLTGHRIIGQGQ